MRFCLFMLFLLLSAGCHPQANNVNAISLSISPGINREDAVNKRIITSLQSFLETKNESPTSNQHWLADDFKKFVYPYAALHNIEQSRLGNNFYQPSLMDITNTKDPAKKIVKIAYIGHNPVTKENTLRTVYNIVANTADNDVVFSSYIEHATSAWKKTSVGSIQYYVSPSKNFNVKEAEKQQQDIQKICGFFGCKPVYITYYSCTDPLELFRIKGFDYNPMMYISDTGGLAEPGNMVFSGNNSEYYTHEIVHVYVANLYPDASAFLNEGIATYLGGSGLHDYNWHKQKLAVHLKHNNPDLAALVENPFDRVYIDDETPVAYIMGGVICEKIIKEYGKEKLISLLQNKANVWTLLKQVGLTKENLKAELLKQL